MLRSRLTTGLLLLASLLSILLLSPSRSAAAALAGAGTGALLSYGAFSAQRVRALLGDFLRPLELLAELALTLLAMGATGGARSELYFLLLAELVLARRFLGPAASRFWGVAGLVGLGVLAAVHGDFAEPAALAPAGLRALGLAALLAAMEAGARLERPARNAGSEILHDLKSPLSVIRVYADLITERVREGKLPPEEHLANLHSEIELMESLVGPSPARHAPRPSPAANRGCDLVPILRALADSYRIANAGRLEIDFEAERSELPIVGDAVALQRALRNVLDNAVKYTPPGGRVRIRAGASGQQAYVVVSDTGIGMTAEEVERAFEFSFRGRAARQSGSEGRGLGLGLSREFIEANGGKIFISSEPDRGSEVTILLPLGPESRR